MSLACVSRADPERHGAHMISTDDAEYPREFRTLGNGGAARRFSNVGLVHTSERRHTVIAAQSLEALSGLPKRDAFLDHLKNKYPPHPLPPTPLPSLPHQGSPQHTQHSPAGGMRGQQDRVREQFGDETRRVHITHELSSADTLHALIVHMFPQKLTTGMLKSANTAILIKDEARNVFYELEDVRDIQDRSVIKIFRKEPLYASYPGSHLANGDLRREMLYTSRDSSPTRRLNSLSPSPHLSSSPPSSSSPSRSRLSYTGGGSGSSRPPSYAGPSHSGHPHHHHPSSSGQGPPPAGISPSPSAILERRDVKPDEELSGRGVLLKSEGLYADPYGQVHEGRLSIASTQSLAAMGDPFTYPVSSGLYRRGSVRSLSTYSAAALQGELEDTLYKPGGPLYPDTYAPTSSIGMGFRVPHSSSSPQKIPDGVQLRDRGDPSSSPYSGSPSRASPVRHSFRKDSASSSVFAESPKSRSGSSSDHPALSGGGGVEVGRLSSSGYGSPLPANGTETRERMEAMEKQIASLTGLVQSVLTRGPDSDSNEKTDSTSEGSGTGSQFPSLQSKMRVVLRVEVEAVKFLKEEPQRLDALLKRCKSVTDSLTNLRRQVNEGIWKSHEDLANQSPKLMDDFSKNSDFHIPTSPPLNFHDLEGVGGGGVLSLSSWQSHSASGLGSQNSPAHSQSSQTVPVKSRVLDELGGRRTVDKSVSVEAAERDWEEKRASLTQYSTQDINRLLEETQAELMKAIPDLDFVAKQQKLSGGVSGGQGSQGGPVPVVTAQSASGNASPTPEHRPGKPQHPAQKLNTKTEHSVRRGSERDWEEKRASLTQYSTQDINRLLEETQAELMKAIPDLDFVAKQQKLSGGVSGGQGSQGRPVPVVTAQSASGNASPTPEHRPGKPQHPAQKLNTKTEHSVRRGSGERRGGDGRGERGGEQGLE
ncbi:UNVERIFIED_CONTAM: hypothetical protein FKN15_051607 [Acipenser sinensis]